MSEIRIRPLEDEDFASGKLRIAVVSCPTFVRGALSTARSCGGVSPVLNTAECDVNYKDPWGILDSTLPNVTLLT